MNAPRMPVVFIGHGSPMNAGEDNASHVDKVTAGSISIPCVQFGDGGT